MSKRDLRNTAVLTPQVRPLSIVQPQSSAFLFEEKPEPVAGEEGAKEWSLPMTIEEYMKLPELAGFSINLKHTAKGKKKEKLGWDVRILFRNGAAAGTSTNKSYVVSFGDYFIENQPRFSSLVVAAGDGCVLMFDNPYFKGSFDSFELPLHKTTRHMKDFTKMAIGQQIFAGLKVSPTQVVGGTNTVFCKVSPYAIKGDADRNFKLEIISQENS